MSKADVVYLIVLSGEDGDACSFADKLFPAAPKVLLAKESLLAAGPRGQLREFRKLRGAALVFFADSIEAISEPKLKLASALAHRCRLTVFGDRTGGCRVYTKWNVLTRTPAFLWSGALDLATLAIAELGHRVLAAGLAKPLPREASESGLDVLVLYPFPFQQLAPGGELSFLRGSLSGFAAAGLRAELVSGCPVPIEMTTPMHIVPNRRSLYLLKESQALSYNTHFTRAARLALGGRQPRFIYQRHGRFVLSGALLARLLRVPFVLEYQTSEYWWAKTWGPSRFLGLLKRIEDLSIRTASLIAVVSDVLRDELIEAGVPSQRIVVTPAAVDPDRFHESSGRERLRQDLGFSPEEIVVGFVGSFSHWHGIPVLARAVLRLLENGAGRPGRLRFLLVGDGPLKKGMEQTLEAHGAAEAAVFTGIAAADHVPGLLNAADILVAPNVQMPEGKSFFGSPTKLFEYMATGKAVVASNLDQLAEVLSDGETALLVPPDDAERLAAAIERLAEDEELRSRIGANARMRVLEGHTWRHNALRVVEALERLAPPAPADSRSGTA